MRARPAQQATLVTRRHGDIPDVCTLLWALPVRRLGGNIQEVRVDAGAVQQAHELGAAWPPALCLELQEEGVGAATCTFQEQTPAEVKDLPHHSHLPLDLLHALAREAHPQVRLGKTSCNYKTLVTLTSVNGPDTN